MLGSRSRGLATKSREKGGQELPSKKAHDVCKESLAWATPAGRLRDFE